MVILYVPRGNVSIFVWARFVNPRLFNISVKDGSEAFTGMT